MLPVGDGTPAATVDPESAKKRALFVGLGVGALAGFVIGVVVSLGVADWAKNDEDERRAARWREES